MLFNTYKDNDTETLFITAIFVSMFRPRSACLIYVTYFQGLF